MIKSVIVSALKTCAAVVVGAALSGAVQAAETEVVFGSPTPASINLANITAAMELGYFSKEGIKPKLQELQGSSIVMSQVAVKSILIGGAGGDPLVMANQPGKTPLPLKFFYNGFRDYVWQFVVLPDSPINTIADLKGKTIGVGALTNGHVAVSKLLLKQNGVDLKDAKFIAIGQGSAAFKALTDGRVDVYNTYNGNLAFYEAYGSKLKYLPMPKTYDELFSFGYFVHEDTLKTQPNLLVAYGRGVAKGTLVCSLAPEWCVKNFWKYYPTLKPRGDDVKELERQVYILNANMKSYLAFTPGQPRRFGEFPASTWKQMVDVLYEGGAISSNKVDPNMFFTNELVDKINDFDVKAIEAQAATLK